MTRTKQRGRRNPLTKVMTTPQKPIKSKTKKRLQKIEELAFINDITYEKCSLCEDVIIGMIEQTCKSLCGRCLSHFNILEIKKGLHKNLLDDSEDFWANLDFIDYFFLIDEPSDNLLKDGEIDKFRWIKYQSEVKGQTYSAYINTIFLLNDIQKKYKLKNFTELFV